MFEYLDIVYNHSENLSINIKVELIGDLINYKYYKSNSNNYYKGTLDRKKSEKFLNELYNIHIENWINDKGVNNIIRDKNIKKSKWFIEYKDSQYDSFFYTIDDNKPNNFDEFLVIIDLIYPVIDPLRIEEVYMNFNSKKLSDNSDNIDDINSQESFIINRYEGSFFHSIRYGNIIKSEQKIFSKVNVQSLLDIMSEKEIFVTEYIDPIIKSENYESFPVYNIEIKRRNGSIMKYEGIFDHCGLPKDWIYFIELVKNFMSFHILSEVLQKRNYETGRARLDEVMYLKIKFGNSSEEQFYISNLSNLKTGDFVIVSEEDNNYKIAVIIDIIYVLKDCIPDKLKDAKNILKKLEVEDLIKINNFDNLSEFNDGQIFKYLNNVD